MTVPTGLLQAVIDNIRRHVRASPGFEAGPWVNPLLPVDCVAAHAVAGLLVKRNAFDVCVSVAPEGHAYGYFFARCGAQILSVHVDYPPQRCQVLDDLSVIRNRRVLILEDDVISGMTLQLVVEGLLPYRAGEMSLFLGRRKEDQFLEHVPCEIRHIYLAENLLDPTDRQRHTMAFEADFSHLNTIHGRQARS